MLADRAALANQKLEQNHRKLFPKSLRLLSGAGLCLVPGPGLALQRGGRLTCHPHPQTRPLPRGSMLCPSLSPCWPQLAPRPVWTLLCVRGLELHKGHVPELRGQLGDRQSPPNPGLTPAFGPEGIDH